jgi:energy-coupling factor transporter ATP-binding protein EcfA2
MKFLRFRISKIRSVDDSGWIEVDKVTALIGTNESGKTNLLLPLWKLNPAKNGEINPIGDYPRKLFNQIRNLQEKPIFVEAVFDVGDNLADQLAKLTRMPAEAVREVTVSRDFDGCYDIDFPEATPSRVIEAACLQALFEEAVEELERLKPLKTEQDLRESIIQAVQHGRASITDTSGRTREHLDPMLAALCAVNTEQAPKTSVLVPRFERLRQDLTALLEEISEPHPAESEAARKLVLKHLPRFVYYSN